MLRTCSNACGFHSKLIRNLLSIASQKNLNLSRRIFHTSSKSIRGRLLSYLSFQATKHGSLEFEIPFNRQQLADYLSVDRSAMSNELSKMQRDGLLKVERNRFILQDTASFIASPLP
jgi:CRP-like cAMP-binding protein